MYANSMHNSMMRRSNNTVRTVAIVVVAGLFLYGLYAYHDLHTRHTRSVEKADRLRQQHDSLSAQLQVVYEQKSRLDKLLQQEKADHKQTKDELAAEKRRIEQKYIAEKEELLNRIRSINSEHKMLQSQHDDLQNTFSKLHNQLLQLEDDCKKAAEKHLRDYNQMKQEKENELAQLKDNVANLQRRNLELQNKLHAAIQQNQISQHQIDAEQQNIAKLQEQLAQLQNVIQGNLVANLHDQKVQQDFNQQQQQQQQQLQQQGFNAGLADNRLQQQQQQQQHEPLALQHNQMFDKEAQQQQQQPDLAQLQMADSQHIVHEVNRQNQAVPVEQQLEKQPEQQHDQQQQQQQQQQQDQQQGPVMQLAQPAEPRKPYFDPKEAKPDHEIILHHVAEEQQVDERNPGNDNVQQVLAPDINQLGAEMKKEYMENKKNNIKDDDFQKLDEGRADDDSWRNIHESNKEERDVDKMEDKDAIHRPGQIVGPDVKNMNADRIVAPVHDQDQFQGQIHNDMNLPQDVNNHDADDEDQLHLPGGHIPVRNDMYQDNQGDNDDEGNRNNNDGDRDDRDEDDEDDDQLDNYPN